MIIPPEVESSQRQMITTTTVGTIQVRMIQMRAIRTPGNFWCEDQRRRRARGAVWTTRVRDDPDHARAERAPETPYHRAPSR